MNKKINHADAFFALDHSSYSTEQLVNLAKHYYEENFIDNYMEWKKMLESINNSIYRTLHEAFNVTESFMEDNKVTYDMLSVTFINSVTSYIEVNGQIRPQDIEGISDKVVKSFLNEIVKSWGKILDQTPAEVKNENVVKSLMDIIKLGTIV